MKVLQITPAFAPAIGGIETVVDRLSRSLTKLGVNCDVAHIAPRLTRNVRLEQGLKVYTLPLFGHRLLGVVPGLGELAAGYDLVHVHDPQVAALTANLAVQAPSIPKVLSTHGGFRHTKRMAPLKWMHERAILPALLNLYDSILASSKEDHIFFSKRSSKVFLVENGVDVNYFAESFHISPRPLSKWIYWGRLSVNKRLDQLLLLVSNVLTSGLEVDLLICGTDFDGLSADLARQIEDLGLSGAVRLSPPLNASELRREIGQRGVFITASEYEGFGLSLIEAMSAGLVVICRNIPPLNGFVESGKSGFFVAFDGSIDDVNGVRAVLGCPSRTVSSIRSGAQRVAAQYDWSSMVTGFLSKYLDALNR